MIRNSCTTFYEEYNFEVGIFTKENKNLYIIDKKSGQFLKKFGNIMKKKPGNFSEIHWIGISNDLIFTSDSFGMVVYDYNTGRKKFYSYYIRPVLDVYHLDYFSLSTDRLKFKKNFIYVIKNKGLFAITVNIR
ncbi:MAG TPA: hypothetical protein PL101_02060 [Bacteroidales bacterium]|nr:hypothetical protein [Bacteroidales bacterium]